MKEACAALRRLGLPDDAAERRLFLPRASASISSAPTTPPASSTSSITCSCRTTREVGGGLDYFQWSSILRSVSALTAYHWVYRESLKPWLVADLLVLNEQMPRSLASCYENLASHPRRAVAAYGRQGPAQRPRRSIRTRLAERRDRATSSRAGLHEFLTEFIADNARLGDAITEQYLA